MPSRNICYAGKDVTGPAESTVTAEPPAAAGAQDQGQNQRETGKKKGAVSVESLSTHN